MPILAVLASWFLLLHPRMVAAPLTATPGMSITASPTTSIGLQIFANVNLTASGATPTGSITFRLYGPGDTSCASAIFTSTVPVSGQSMNSASYTTTRAGTYQWTAAYGGDGNDNPVGPTACSASTGSVVVAAARPAIAMSAPAPSGGTIHGVATLGGGYGPTGSITFSLSAPGDSFCSQPIFTSTVAIGGNGTYNSGNYTPTVTGTYSWQAQYNGDGNNLAGIETACINNNNTVNVTSITPLAPAPTFSPTSLSFAAQTMGTASAVQTVSVGNTGTGNLVISSVALSGAGAASFVASGDHCTGVTVAPGGTCSVGVSLSPVAAGSVSASLTVSDNGPGGSQVVALSGQGTANAALFTYPVAGATAVDTTKPFTWTAFASAQGYLLLVGTSQYGYNLVNSGVLAASSSSFAVPALPTGVTLYGTLYTEVGGSWSRYQAITFTAAPGMATFVSPVNGQGSVGRAPLFRWSTIPQAQGYLLIVGTKQYGYNTVNSGILAATKSSYQATGLPAGKTLYATLYTETNGTWSRYQAITFTTS